MNFHVNKIILWFRNGSEREEFSFKPNKVNVITGGSGTGKTSILSIIDYCLLSTKANIPEEVINESVSWYGLKFTINNKKFTIARKSPINAVGSKEVYFSGTGIIPEIPVPNNDVTQLKSVIEREFGIDENLKIPFGGKYISAGSKISYRYFLLFNTLSEDTISHTNIFFDYDLYDREKYVEALERIFYLAIGVDDVSNVLAKEKVDGLEKELLKNEKRRKAVDKEERLFNDKIFDLIVKAQEYDLIERKPFTSEDGYTRLKKLVVEHVTADYSNNMQLVDELNKTKRSIFRKIRNLERFNSEYEIYKKNLKKDYDSLLPIKYLNKNFQDLIPTLEVKTFLKTLENSLLKIKNEISKKNTFSINTKSEIENLKKEITEIDKQLSKLPTSSKDYTNEAQKFIFIGELKSQLKFYEDKWNLDDELFNTSKIEQDIDELRKIIEDTNLKRRLSLNDLESSIQSFYDQSNSMGVYNNHKVLFDVKSKSLKVRRANEATITTIGSKSNFMFLHLFLFLGLHKHFLSLEHSYVPNFLFLDQPSQPYYEGKTDDDDIVDDDKIKLQDAFKLLNDFISEVRGKQNLSFQIILLEHARPDYWEEIDLKNFYLVREFRNGKALIPDRALVKN